MASEVENESCAAGGRAASDDARYITGTSVESGPGLRGEQTRTSRTKVYDGPQEPSGALPAAEPTPIATGCDTMPL
jgi:hypothetical protein